MKDNRGIPVVLTIVLHERSMVVMEKEVKSVHHLVEEELNEVKSVHQRVLEEESPLVHFLWMKDDSIGLWAPMVRIFF